MLLQGMSAKLGILTQKGLAENIVDTFASRPVLKKIIVWVIAISLTLGGFAYAGGDLTGTSIGLSALTGIPANYIAPVWGIIILVIVTLHDIKWLEKLLCVCVGFMALFFILTMFVVKPDFGAVSAGMVPYVPKGSLIYCLSLIGISGLPWEQAL